MAWGRASCLDSGPKVRRYSPDTPFVPGRSTAWMTGQNPRSYTFGGFVLDLGRGVLLEDGAERALRPKTFALLRHMIENAGRLINRDEIMRAVWPDTFVTEDSITQCIGEIRRALGDPGQATLRTIPRRGYLFDGPVSRLEHVAARSSHRGPFYPGRRPPDRPETPLPATGRPIVIVAAVRQHRRRPGARLFRRRPDGGSGDRPDAVSGIACRQPTAPAGEPGAIPRSTRSPRRCPPRLVSFSVERCGAPADGSASRSGSLTRAAMSICGRNVLTARSKTCSPCRRI